MSAWVAVSLDAGRDGNGNPLRGYMLYKDGRCTAFIDEGYAGVWCIAASGLVPRGEAVHVLEPSIPTTPAFYRQLLGSERKAIEADER